VNEIKSEVKERWEKLTDDDLAVVCPAPLQSVQESGMDKETGPSAPAPYLSPLVRQGGRIHIPFSDVAGRHIVHLKNTADSRHEFVIKLANAGCNVQTSGTDWLSEGNFDA